MIKPFPLNDIGKMRELADRMLRFACDYCGRTDPPKDGRCEGCGAPRKMPKPPVVPLAEYGIR